MQWLIFALFAFLLGSFPTAYWAGRRFKNIDIRQHGSGNVGATNAFRVLGKKVGALVFFCDFLKGALPTFFYILASSQQPPYAPLILGVGLCAILGHIFTPFLNFKGGKGIATGAGVIFASFPLLFVAFLLVWAVTFLIWRIVSVSSLAALFSVVVLSVFLQLGRISISLFFILFLLVAWSHRENLKRLRRGEEKPIGKKTKN